MLAFDEAAGSSDAADLAAAALACTTQVWSAGCLHCEHTIYTRAADVSSHIMACAVEAAAPVPQRRAAGLC